MPLLNNVLGTFVDPGAFCANPQLVAKFKFEKAPALSDLLQIYVNLDVLVILPRLTTFCAVKSSKMSDTIRKTIFQRLYRELVTSTTLLLM